MKRSFIQKRHWILLFGIIPPLLIILVLAVVLFFVPPNSEIMMEKTQVGWNLVIALLVSLLCAISSIYYWRNHAVTPQQVCQFAFIPRGSTRLTIISSRGYFVAAMRFDCIL